jgi:hypothetical protein
MVPCMRLHVAHCILHQICPLPWCMDDLGNRIGLYLTPGSVQRLYRQRTRRGLQIPTTSIRARIAKAQLLGRYVELDLEESTANRCSTILSEYLPTLKTAQTEEWDTHGKARGPGKHIDYTEEGTTNRQLKQPTLRPTENWTRGVRAVSLSSDDVAISGVEPPLEEGSQDDDKNPRRRVDNGADNGRSSSPDIGGRKAGTGHNTTYYTAE